MTTKKSRAKSTEPSAAAKPVAGEANHKHDFKPNGDVDAGRPIEVCACGERRVEGDPTTRSR